MSDIRYLPIEPDRLAAMRDRAADEFGNPWTLRVAEGWEPLRCCLRPAAAEEDIALICYTPWTKASPWAEAGPVFVHFGRCAGYPTHDVFPEAFLRQRSILNPFDHSGARAYDHITFIGPDDDHEVYIRKVLAEPDVAYLHVRSASAGCFTFAVHPAEA